MKRIIGRIQTGPDILRGCILKVDKKKENNAIQFFQGFHEYLDVVISDCQLLANKQSCSIELKSSFLKTLYSNNFESPLIKAQKYIMPAFFETFADTLYVVDVYKPHSNKIIEALQPYEPTNNLTKNNENQ